MPFKFDMSTLDARDIADSIEALEFLLSNMPEQQHNILFQCLLGVMSDEWHRRRGADLPEQHEIDLPLSEATNAHVWALVKFAGSVIQAAANGEPSQMGRFFGCVIDGIERSAGRIAAAAMN